MSARVSDLDVDAGELRDEARAVVGVAVLAQREDEVPTVDRLLATQTLSALGAHRKRLSSRFAKVDSHTNSSTYFSSLLIEIIS